MVAGHPPHGRLRCPGQLCQAASPGSIKLISRQLPTLWVTLGAQQRRHEATALLALFRGTPWHQAYS